MKRIKELLQNHPGSLASLDLSYDLDQVNFEERDVVLVELLKRVEIGGYIYIRGTDINAFCTDVYRGKILEPETIFSKYKSMSRLDYMYNALVSSNFNVLLSEREGMNYYIVGKRNA